MDQNSTGKIPIKKPGNPGQPVNPGQPGYSDKFKNMPPPRIIPKNLKISRNSLEKNTDSRSMDKFANINKDVYEKNDYQNRISIDSYDDDSLHSISSSGTNYMRGSQRNSADNYDTRMDNNDSQFVVGAVDEGIYMYIYT
jgi:hypothetical protein